MTNLMNYSLEQVKAPVLAAIGSHAENVLNVIASTSVLIVRLNGVSSDKNPIIDLKSKEVNKGLSEIFDTRNGTQSVYRKAALRYAFFNTRKILEVVKKSNGLNEAVAILRETELSKLVAIDGLLYGEVYGKQTLLPALPLLPDDELKAKTAQSIREQKEAEKKAEKEANKEEAPETSSESEIDNFAPVAKSQANELESLAEDMLFGTEQSKVMFTDFINVIFGLIPVPEGDTKLALLREEFAKMQAKLGYEVGFHFHDDTEEAIAA
jgi:hypothetical protein